MLHADWCLTSNAVPNSRPQAVLEQTRTKLAEATSDGYEEKFQQQLHATHDEHREVAEKREAVLHSRLQEHQCGRLDIISQLHNAPHTPWHTTCSWCP